MRDTCPECGSKNYRPTEGCGYCLDCGYDGCTVEKVSSRQEPKKIVD